MYLIDQHASHERVVFEQILAERRDRPATSQGLLTPATVQLTSRQLEAIAPLNDLLSSYGFEWEPVGDDAILLRAMPAALKESEAPQAFLEVLDEHSDSSPRPSSSPHSGESRNPSEISPPDTVDASDSIIASGADAVDMRERRIAATIACHSTVRAGQTLSLSEMESLITLFRDANFPRLCPHGRPTMVHLSSAQLERQFARR